MARLRTCRNAGKTPINNSDTSVPISAVTHASTHAPA